MISGHATKKVLHAVRKPIADFASESQNKNRQITNTVILVLSSCTGSQEPIQKTQQCSTAKQRFVNKRVQWLFPLCTGTPGHNRFPGR